MSNLRKSSDASSGIFSESPGSHSEHRLPLPLGHSNSEGTRTLERQDSLDSVEYHSQLEDNKEDGEVEEDEEEEEEMAMPTANKKGCKKKLHFGIFRKSKSKDRMKNKVSPTEGLMHTLSVPGEASHSSSLRQTLSESEGSVEHWKTQSYQEFAETLMNPTPRASLLGAESRLEDIYSSGEEVPTEREHIVYVTLHSGHHLAIRDRTGSSDPYVKFRCGRFKYRSAVIHRNLNPEWNESFSFKTTDLHHIPLTIRVYDYDYGTLDDFMGRTSVNLSPYSDGELHIVDLGLEDPVATMRGETLGSIRIFLQITEGDLAKAITDSPTPKPSTNKCQRSTQLWRSMLGVTLLEGISLPAMDDNGFSDPYCKFKLGSQKYKSKIRQKTLNPQWKERFELRMYDGDSTTLHMEVWDKDFPQSDDFIGGCEVDLKSLKPEATHDIKLHLKGADRMDAGAIHVLLVITGTAVEEEDVDGREEHAALESTPGDINMSDVRKRYALMRTTDLKAVKDVGFLRVKIERAEGLPSLDTCAIVEVGNAAVRTQTVYKTANPVWNKTFCFNVKDVHDDLEVMVYSEVKKKAGLIGKIKVPLLRLENGVSKVYVLKDRHCLQCAKGVVFLECELVYNPVRACIRTINPRETKLLDEEQKFKRKVLMNNIRRVISLIRTLGDAWEFIKSLWSWENKAKSTAAFIIFLIVCLFGELWMFFVVGAFIFLNQYLVVYIRGKHDWQISQRRALSVHSFEESQEDLSDLSDFTDFEDEMDSKQQDTRKSLREKFRQIQEVLVIVQTVLGFLADLGERVKNLFDWSVPFLCWMAVTIFLLASFLFYYVPLRYVILVWGINKFTKRLRKPNFIENNELLDFLSRSPTDRQLLEWHEPYSRSGSTIKKHKKKRR